MDEQAGKQPSRWRWPAIGAAVAVIGAVAFVMARGPSNVGTAKEIQRDVEVRSGDRAFQPVREHPNVKKGDVVRTSKDGLGEIDYGDGSVTRLDGDTTFKVDELLTQTKRVVRASLSKGRVWNKVESLTESEDQFEIHTPNAVASVRGTIYFIEVLPLGSGLFETTLVQVTGRTAGVWDNGATVEAGGGQCFTNGGPCRYTSAQLVAMLQKFAQLDGIDLQKVFKTVKHSAEVAEQLPEVQAPGRAVAGVAKQLQPENELRKRQPSVENHDDEEDSDDRDDNDRSNEPREFSSDTGGGDTSGGDSGDSGGCEEDANRGGGNNCDRNDVDNPNHGI